jgi:mono/diheme cytochrome c family protein
MKKIRRVPSLTALAVFCLAFLGAMAPPASAGSEIERGKYLATIMDCTGCHTGGALAGAPDPARYLVGSDIGFHLPGLGIFYPPNLTPDAETGLGNWSEDEIIAAVREGLRPDGRELAPIMPWHSYAVLTDPDALALARYLKSLPPASFQVPGPFGEGGTVTSPYLSVVMPQ